MGCVGVESGDDGCVASSHSFSLESSVPTSIEVVEEDDVAEPARDDGRVVEEDDVCVFVGDGNVRNGHPKKRGPKRGRG